MISAGDMRPLCSLSLALYFISDSPPPAVHLWPPSSVGQILVFLAFSQGHKVSYSSIHKSLLAGLPDMLGMKDDKSELYKGCRGKSFRVHPSSPMQNKGCKWLLAGSLIDTTQVYATSVARFEPQWAEQVLPHLVRTSFGSPAWEREANRVTVMKQVHLVRFVRLQPNPPSISKCALSGRRLQPFNGPRRWVGSSECVPRLWVLSFVVRPKSIGVLPGVLMLMGGPSQADVKTEV